MPDTQTSNTLPTYTYKHEHDQRHPRAGQERSFWEAEL